MKNYNKVVYSINNKPKSNYPNELATYFCKRFKLKPKMKFLDNGCGRGDFLESFARMGLEVYGTDVDPVKETKRIHKVDLENERLPFENDYFDVIFSKSVIEHINDTHHYMTEMKRVLAPGGILIMLVPDWKSQYKIFFEDPTHVHPYCTESLEKLLMMYEFEKSGAELFYQLPFIWKFPLIKKFDFMKTFGVSKIHTNKTYRFFREKMVLGFGYK